MQEPAGTLHELLATSYSLVSVDLASQFRIGCPGSAKHTLMRIHDSVLDTRLNARRSAAPRDIMLQ